MALTEKQRSNLELQRDQYRQHSDRLDYEALSEADMFLAAAREYGSELAGPPSSIAEKRKQAAQARLRVKKIEAILELDIHPDMLIASCEKQLTDLKNRAASLVATHTALAEEIEHFRTIAKSLTP